MVQRVREKLGLDAFAFAALLCVHTSTIYRWEGSRKTLIHVEPISDAIIRELETKLAAMPPEEVAALSKAIADALLSGDRLRPLYVLLTHLLREKISCEPPTV